MELHDYVRVIRNRWMTIFVLALFGLLAGVGFSLAAAKVYDSSAKMFVRLQTTGANADGSNSVYAGSQFVLQRMKSYTELANSNAVLQPVIDALGLHTSVSKLASKVSIGNPADTVILVVTVSDQSPRVAARIANQVAESLSTTIENLETPGVAGNTSRVVVTITKRATAPSSATSPHTFLNVALGLVSGLALGLIVAIVRQQTNARVESARDVQEFTGARPLAVVRRHRRAEAEPIAALGSGDQSAADAYRRLCVNLALAADAGTGLPRAVVVAAPSAGVGRRLTACNLAAAAAQMGVKVCLVEADIGNPRIAMMLGLGVERGLPALLADADAADAAVSYGDGLLDVVAMPATSIPTQRLAASSVRQVMDALCSRYEMVVFDAPPLDVASDALLLGRHASGVLLVIRDRRTTRAQVIDFMDSLAGVGVRYLGSVVTYSRHRDRRASRLRSGRGLGRSARSAPADANAGGREAVGPERSVETAETSAKRAEQSAGDGPTEGVRRAGRIG